MASRDRQIVRASMVGVAGNVLLAAAKAMVGVLSGSIAIVLDAVNNLSDALSSLITIIGTKLAAKPADREHPFGYGRIEYLSAVVISAIVLSAGISSLRESALSILDHDLPTYDALSLGIVAAAVVAKLVLGGYALSVGRRVSSDSLVASGTDATLDAVISASTLVAAFVFMACGVSLEGWLGIVISLVIVKSGIDMLRETLSKILGERVDATLSRRVKEAVESVEGVRGAYDLLLSDYGPERLQGSIHVGGDDFMDAQGIDALSRTIQRVVFDKTGVIITTVGVYASNSSSEEAGRLLREVTRIVGKRREVLEMHGFYANLEAKTVSFDVIVSFDAGFGRKEVVDDIARRCREAIPGYDFLVTLDSDVSD